VSSPTAIAINNALVWGWARPSRLPVRADGDSSDAALAAGQIDQHRIDDLAKLEMFLGVDERGRLGARDR
jgi:hypothetical protein